MVRLRPLGSPRNYLLVLRSGLFELDWTVLFLFSLELRNVGGLSQQIKCEIFVKPETGQIQACDWSCDLGSQFGSVFFIVFVFCNILMGLQHIGHLRRNLGQLTFSVFGRGLGATTVIVRFSKLGTNSLQMRECSAKMLLKSLLYPFSICFSCYLCLGFWWLTGLLVRLVALQLGR